MGDKMYCNKCRKQLESTYKFCPVCGEPLVDADIAEQEGLWTTWIENTIEEEKKDLGTAEKEDKKDDSERLIAFDIIKSVFIFIMTLLVVVAGIVGYKSYWDKKNDMDLYKDTSKIVVNLTDLGGYEIWEATGFEEAVYTNISVPYPPAYPNRDNITVYIGEGRTHVGIIMQKDESRVMEWEWLNDKDNVAYNGCISVNVLLSYFKQDEESGLPIFLVSNVKSINNPESEIEYSETRANNAETIPSETALKDIDFAAYFDGMDRFINEYPDLLQSGSGNLYADKSGIVLIQCDGENTPQYIDISGDAEDSPSFYTIKIGMTNNEAVDKVPGTYELMEADEYGYAYYNPEKHTYIIWFSNEDTGRIIRLVYLTEKGYDLYWGNTEPTEQYDNSWEYILPDSDQRVYSEDELLYLSSDDIQMAINEIYARHGRKFDDKSIQEYFNSKSWYWGTVEPDDFSDSVLSDVEKRNLQILTEIRNGTSYDNAHTKMVVLNSSGFDFNEIYLKPSNSNEWLYSSSEIIYDEGQSRSFSMDIDRNDGA